MIPFDFIYIKPESLSEAALAYSKLNADGKCPVYYGGGSEIITMSRTGSIHPGAVIDLKGIRECLALDTTQDTLLIGAANTLNRIKESKLFPLLGTACGRIADHTNQCRITLGGNLCGTIIYRETSLPLLLCDADVLIYGPEGARIAPMGTALEQRMRLSPGEFVVQAHVPSWALRARYAHIKKTAHEKIDYPLVNVTALWHGGDLRIAFSGLCPFPFRSAAIEQTLNNRSLSLKERLRNAEELLPGPAHSDAEGSGAYRLFVLKNTLQTLLEDWDHGEI